MIVPAPALGEAAKALSPPTPHPLPRGKGAGAYAREAGNNAGMLTDLLLLERLSDADLALLAEVAGEPGSRLEQAARLRGRPDTIEALLARPDVFAALFQGAGEDPIVAAGPFVAFAVLLAQTPALLARLSFVPERVGRRSTVPVFEIAPLRDFVADPLRRLFLADLLASYTHVASGALWVKSRRGWRHRRFSELDPAQFAQLILSVPPDERLVLYRRLGDLALFLSGVFPDHVAGRTLTPIAPRACAARSVGESRPRRPRRSAARGRRVSAICACWSGSGSAPTASPGRPPEAAISASLRSWATRPSISATPASSSISSPTATCSSSASAGSRSGRRDFAFGSSHLAFESS